MADPARMLLGLSELVQRGISDIGQSRLQRAQLGLAGKKLGWEMGQYKKYQQPILAAQAQEAQAQMEFLNQPFNIKSLMPGVGGTLPWGNFVEKTIPEIEKHLGFKISPTGEVLHPQTKMPMTRRDMQPFGPAIQAIWMAKMDFNERGQDLAAQGDPSLLKQMTEDPVPIWNKQIQQMEFGRAWMQSIFPKTPTDFWDRNIERVQNQINAWTTAKAKRAEQKYERETRIKVEEEKGKQARLTLAEKPPTPAKGEDEGSLRDDYEKLIRLEKSLMAGNLDNPNVALLLAIRPDLAGDIKAQNFEELLKEVRTEKKNIKRRLDAIRGTEEEWEYTYEGGWNQ